MSWHKIPYDLKRRCVEAYKEGKLNSHEIYEQIFKPEWDGMEWDTFRHEINKWKNKQMADPATQEAATYPGFFAHAATVQVTGNGTIQQAWVRTKAEEVDWDAIVARLQAAVVPQTPEVLTGSPEAMMLEIPLFDQHFGVAKYADYEAILGEIVQEIRSRKWEEVHIIIGQDVLHTNDLRGHTAKGTDIGAVDIPTAWDDAWRFYSVLFNEAIKYAARVYAHYSRGNHDECLAWAFFRALEAGFPTVISDHSLAHRKAFMWRRCFVGYGHLNYTTNSDKIFRDFVTEFADLFAAAEVREIHTGHLHRESCDNGIMVRRLASAVPVDEWSSANGYVGVHKRFQLFEYGPGRLRSIVYV